MVSFFSSEMLSLLSLIVGFISVILIGLGLRKCFATEWDVNQLLSECEYEAAELQERFRAEDMRSSTRLHLNSLWSLWKAIDEHGSWWRRIIWSSSSIEHLNDKLLELRKLGDTMTRDAIPLKKDVRLAIGAHKAYYRYRREGPRPHIGYWLLSNLLMVISLLLSVAGGICTLKANHLATKGYGILVFLSSATFVKTLVSWQSGETEHNTEVKESVEYK